MTDYPLNAGVGFDDNLLNDIYLPHYASHRIQPLPAFLDSVAESSEAKDVPSINSFLGYSEVAGDIAPWMASLNAPQQPYDKHIMQSNVFKAQQSSSSGSGTFSSISKYSTFSDDTGVDERGPRPYVIFVICSALKNLHLH